MTRVVGIGGIFFKARDPEVLRAWYRKHLGMDIQAWGGMAFRRNHPDMRDRDGTTVWSVFKESSNYFARTSFLILHDMFQQFVPVPC